MFLLLCGAGLLLDPLPAQGQSSAGTAVQFDGVDDYVQVPHNAALNAYPLTITAWIRTTRNGVFVDSVATKYLDGSFNGYGLYVYNGRIRGWYFRNGSAYVWDGAQGLDGGFVADGRWHHVALVVDANGGRLYLDGALNNAASSRAWTLFGGNVPGPAATTQPLQIGRYSTYPNVFLGQIDEVTLWNQALSANQINYLKHRRLGGTEDGLLAWWRFNENGGTAAADETGHGYNGTLLNGPTWVASTAPFTLEPVAGTAFRANGVDSQVIVPHDAAHDAFPITIMAWVKTAQTAGAYPGIVTKYRGNSSEGYALALNAGRLAPWYYVDGTRFIDPGFTGANDRFIADGQWHHVAFVVDGTSGRTFIDGALANTQLWTGTAGATATTEPLRLGTYLDGAGLFFNGQIDAVSIWNTALSAAQISQYFRSPINGSEPGLISAYNLDEASGDDALDVTGLANGNAPAGLTRIGSLAPLGDGSVHLVRAVDLLTLGRGHAIRTMASRSSFPLGGGATFWRYYDGGIAPASLPVSVNLAGTLTDAGTAAAIPLNPNALTASPTLGAYNAASPISGSGYFNLSGTLPLEPAVGVQLDSVNTTYQPGATLSHSESGGPFAEDEVTMLGPTNLLHFSGRILSGGVITIFTNILNTPTALSFSLPDYLNTQLTVALNAGYILGKPAFTFGNGTPINVRLLPTGDAELPPGTSLAVNQPVPDFEKVNNIPVTRDYVRLEDTGTKAVFTVSLPAGLGYSDSPTNRLLEWIVEFSTEVDVGQDLLPVMPSLSYGFFQPVYFAEETKPLWLPVDSIEWRVAVGELVLNRSGAPVLHVRNDEYLTLQTVEVTLADQDSAYKKSNDRYYETASAGAEPWIVRGDANCAALLSMDLNVAGSFLRSHFPYNNVLQWNSGALVISNDLIDTAQSALQINFPVGLSYARDCTNVVCGTMLGPETLSFDAAGGELRFTRDGGLFGDGTITSRPLTWGYIDGGAAAPRFAQRTDAFTDSAYHMPGTFLRGGQTTLGANDRAAAILFSGFGQPGNANRVERPLTTFYEQGFANYAGLNFRVGSPGAKQGESILANVSTGPYPLTGQSKYYVRQGGVSGIHESAAGSFTTRLYGYDITFFNYKLSYLDSQNWQSRTDGALKLPGPGDLPEGPAGFTQEFAEMTFGCRGELEDAKIPPTSGEKLVRYWDATIKPLALEFKGNPALACNVGDNRFLVLGVETKIANVPESLHGELGFKSNGNLVTAAEERTSGSKFFNTGVRSRFKLPPNITLRGPNDSFYHVTIGSDACLSNWENPERPSQGFVSFAGKMDLPFFEDMKIHLHTSANKTQADRVFLAGGWPAADSSAPDRGWSVGGKDFFNDDLFDAAHRGWPGGIALNDYRDSGPEQFNPRAQQTWLDIVDLDYPLAWSPLSRQFTSSTESNTRLLVLDVKNRLKNLTPGRAEIDFGLEFGLPKISVANLAFDALEGATPAGNALSSALGGATQITDGLKSMQKVLNAQPQEFLRPSFDAWLDPYVNDLYSALVADYNGNPYASFRAVIPIRINTTVQTGGQNLANRLKGINDQSIGAARVAQQANQSINTAVAGIDRMLALVQDRAIVRNLINSLIGQQAPQFVGALADSALSGLMDQAQPTFDDIANRLRAARTRLSTATSALDGELARIPFDNAAEYPNIAARVATGAQMYFDRVGASGGDLFAQKSATEIKAGLKRQIEEQFYGSPIPAKYQVTLKQRMYDPDSLMRESLDTVFAQANQIIRDGLSSAAAQLDNTINNFLGDLSEAIGAGKVTGFAAINGDSLSEIRLDAMLKLKIPDDLEFNGYLRVLELNSENAPEGCRPETGSATEVTFGARDVALDWISPKLRASLGGKVTLEKGFPVGLGGSFEMTGELTFEIFTLKELAAAIAFGKYENYLGARARAKVNRHEYAVGVFFGRTCNIDPLMLVDPEVASVLPQNYPLTGVYIYGEAWFPLNEALGIPSSCLFSIRAGAGVGAFYFQTGLDGPATYGGKILYGLSGELLCIISIQGELKGIGVKYGDLLTLKAIGKVSAELGFCPFCLSFSKSISVTVRTSTSGDVDYDIDF